VLSLSAGWWRPPQYRILLGNSIHPYRSTKSHFDNHIALITNTYVGSGVQSQVTGSADGADRLRSKAPPAFQGSSRCASRARPPLRECGLSSRQPCRAWRTLNERVDFRDFSHLQPNSRGPSASSQTNNARIGPTTVWRSSRSRLLTSNFIPCEAASSTLKSGHLLTRLRERWFLPDRQAARYPTFSS
jgi:hypothetical protein